MKTIYTLLIALVTTYVAADIKQELFDAVDNNNITQVQALLTAEPNLINAQDEYGNTPLHWAVILRGKNRKGYKELAKLLIASGAQVNVQNKKGNTPLHQATLNGRNELSQQLIASGAQVNAQDKYGWTPPHWATSTGNKELVELLIASGAQINAQDSNGWTPLQEALFYGNTEVAEHLLEQPAINLDLHNIDKKTAFDIAKEKGRAEIADLIQNTSIKRKGKLSEWILHLKKPLSDVVIETEK